MAPSNRVKSLFVVLFAAALGTAIFSSDMASAQAPVAGKQVFDQNCAACHASGALGAPKLGNQADWAPRISKGIATLDQHALQGFKAMPAKGGNPRLSNSDVQAAVAYMVAQAKSAQAQPARGLTVQLPPEKANFKDGRGVEIARAQCMICHSADYITTQPPLTNRKQWLETVYKMQLRFGAPIPDSQIDPLVNYLVKYYGDKDQPRD